MIWIHKICYHSTHSAMNFSWPLCMLLHWHLKHLILAVICSICSILFPWQLFNSIFTAFTSFASFHYSTISLFIFISYGSSACSLILDFHATDIERRPIDSHTNPPHTNKQALQHTQKTHLHYFKIVKDKTSSSLLVSDLWNQFYHICCVS